MGDSHAPDTAPSAGRRAVVPERGHDLPIEGLPDSRRRTRLLIAALTLSFGVAGILMLPTGQIHGPIAWAILASSLTTFPVAALWFLRPWPSPRVAKWFVVYADVGIFITLLAFDDSFVAMPGCALFSIVALFTVVGASARVLTVHLAASLTTLLLLAALAVSEGVDPWLVGSRAFTLASLFASPFVLQAYIRHLRRLVLGAQRDPLTGLWNRRGLFDAVEDSVATDATPGATRTVGVTVIDIDKFKSINDRFGHATGDAVLVEVARRLERAVGADSVVCRLGGDEFVCVHFGSRARIEEADGGIRAALEESSSGPPFTTSVGSAADSLYSGSSASGAVRTLIARADLEMYRGKLGPNDAAGGDVNEGDVRAVRERVAALIDEGGPDVVFQPICDSATGAVVGYEALSRFPFGHGSPMIWFRDATEADVGQQLELAAIDRALSAMSALADGAFVSLNASAETIRTTDLLARLSPHMSVRTLCIEITEHERVHDYRAVARSVEQLRSAGVLISVDDVGEGYSGIRQVVELEPDILKIDFALVHGLDTDLVRRAATASIVQFAHDIGSKVVFEGVQTEAERLAAIDVGADYLQGYMLGHPSPAGRRSA